jgi:hypothetical protein
VTTRPTTVGTPPGLDLTDFEPFRALVEANRDSLAGVRIVSNDPVVIFAVQVLADTPPALIEEAVASLPDRVDITLVVVDRSFTEMEAVIARIRDHWNRYRTDRASATPETNVIAAFAAAGFTVVDFVTEPEMQTIPVSIDPATSVPFDTDAEVRSIVTELSPANADLIAVLRFERSGPPVPL